MKIRKFEKADYPQLIHLWQTVFGDSPEFVENFLNELIGPRRGYVAETDGTITAAAYIIDGISVNGQAYPYIYAVSTLPEYRGRGYGRAVTEACAELIRSEGDIPCLHPAEESLFIWYGQIGFASTFHVCEAEMHAESKPISLTSLSSAEYNQLRSSMLQEHCFAEFDIRLLNWWQQNWGGRLYGFEGGCMAVTENGEFVPELIAKKNALGAVAALGTDKAIIRTPDIDGLEHLGAKKAFVSTIGSPVTTGYWGFAFD